MLYRPRAEYEPPRLGGPGELQLVDEVSDVEALTPGQLLKEDAPVVKVKPLGSPVARRIYINLDLDSARIGKKPTVIGSIVSHT